MVMSDFLNVSTSSTLGPTALALGNTTMVFTQFDKFILPCDIQPPWEAFKSWTKDGQKLPIYVVNKDWNLVVDFPALEEAGLYTCSADTVCGTVTQHIHLVVKGLPNVQRIATGGTAYLGCGPLEKVAFISVQWFKTGIPINCSGSAQFQCQGDGGLRIHNVSEDEADNYTCQVMFHEMIRKNYTTRLVVSLPEYVSSLPDSETDTVKTFSLIFVPFLGAVAVILAVVFFLRKRRANKRVLTASEMRKFKDGCSVQDQEKSEVALVYDGVPYDNSYELPSVAMKIERSNVIGEGQFGIVYKGMVELDNKSEIVAFKTIKTDADTKRRKQELNCLLSEIKMMIHVGKHPNIIRFVGASTRKISRGEVYLGLEFCDNGSLEKLLRSSKHSIEDQTNDYMNQTEPKPERFTITPVMQSEWSFQISKAMHYLKTKKIVHSDLATRNVLVAKDLTVRVTDFGLSRTLQAYTYVKTGEEPLPWRWLAIESLERREFSAKSDVWSYGITLWEIYSMGDIPYGTHNWSRDFMVLLKTGMRPPLPLYASEQIYDKMKECWHQDPSLRPAFDDIVLFFRDICYKDQNIVYL